MTKDYGNLSILELSSLLAEKSDELVRDIENKPKSKKDGDK